MNHGGDRRLFWFGAAMAIAVAAGLSVWASTAPDGLEHSAAQLGLAPTETAHAAVLPDYKTPGLVVGWGSRAVAGTAGVLALLAAGAALSWWMRRRVEGTGGGSAVEERLS